MTHKNYVPPTYHMHTLGAFNCAYCGAYAVQSWATHLENMSVGYCTLCKKMSLWERYSEDVIEGEKIIKHVNGKLLYPSTFAPMPIEDMPEEIKSDYMEAREIAGASPRASAALLRLCVQKLMPLLGEKGKDINDDISSLVKKGLPIEVQQALDSLRVIGNESVHPGTINLNDDLETALALFNLLNFIVERMITQPKKISAIFNQLPQSKLDAITKRDAPKI